MPRIGERGWVLSGVKVFDNAVAPASWTALDLSAVVGVNPAFVFLQLKNRHATDPTIVSFRINHLTPYVVHGATNAAGINIIHIEDGAYGHIPFGTDKNGVMQWISTDPNPMDIWVLGYIR